MSSHSRPAFPNYMQMRQAIPIPVWHAIRVLSVGFALGLCVVLFVRPEMGLFIFWSVLVPLLPLLFFVAPGVWRNICPMAALNQTPRLFAFTRALTPPAWFKEYGYLIAITLFLLFASSRKVLFNYSGPALAVLILGVLVAAFVMGSIFKGKSGWCSSICPLLPVQRIYGQTPFVTVPNGHCQPCVGCTKNCYDFNPHVAYLADMHDEDQNFSAYRKLFVGLFPGFVLAYYTIPDPPAISVWQMYGAFGLFLLMSAGSFFVLDSLLKVSSNKIAVVYGAVALNLYYWFNAPALADLVGGAVAQWVAWSLQAVVLGLSLIWIYRTYRKERRFMNELIAPQAIQVGSGQSLVAHRATQVGNPEIVFEPDGKRIVAQPGRTILEIAESNNLPIEAGCRMGVCGADPVTIKDGMENLSAVSGDERTTLERLGLGQHTRMACMCRVRGNARVSLKPEQPDQFQSSIVRGFNYDRAIKSIVVIGNGIAGVTAADHVRRRHPLCEIHLVGRERHHLYNRMAITRLIYGRSAMEGLYLMPEQWYKDQNITTWLNTKVTSIDPQARQVVLGTGESLLYDRLILTTGSQSFVPQIEGYGMRGTFVLRDAEDAMEIRAFVQDTMCRQGVVAGGGLLGLEAAYALHKLGMHVAVLERSDTLLRRQLDARGADFLRHYLEELGLNIVMHAETASVQGSQRVQQVTLKDGRTLPCDLFLVCAGIKANTDLAQSIGLDTKRGIVVNERMRSSLPDVYAAGDVAEYGGQVYGLWPVAVSQAETAAVNAVGGDQIYTEVVPVTMLKVAGIDLTSIGRVHRETKHEEEITLEDIQEQRYRKLLIAEGKVVGAILIGFPMEAPGVAEAVKQQLDVWPDLEQLRAGDWHTLTRLVE